MAGDLGVGKKPIAAINVTPLVDIMLVLLIVFMVATQAVDSASVPVKLPKASSAASSAPSALLVHIESTGGIRLDGRPVDRPGLRRFLTRRVASDTSLQVVLAADENLPYARVMAVLDDVRSAGVSRYALKVRVGDTP